MKFLLKNEDWRRIFIYASSMIIAISAYLLFTRVNDIYGFIGKTFGVLLPFILGFGLAFIMSGPVGWLDNRLALWIHKPRKRRLFATALIFLMAVMFVYWAMSVVIPSLVDSFKVFVENFSTYSDKTEEWLVDTGTNLSLNPDEIRKFFNSLNLTHTLNTFLTNSLSKMMNYSISFVKTLSNMIIAIAAAFYMLLYKEELIRSLKTLMYAIISPQRANFMTLYSIDAKNVFQQYIVGNILDSLLVGVICWIFMLILEIPYAPMIGFIVGVTNVIPVFGPFLGAIPVILLLLLIHPMYALIFAIFILILQQIDGNILKPVILGDKLGLNGFWILFSVTIGGSLFGVPGMFLGVPVFALIYEAIQDLVEIQLNRRHLKIPQESGVILSSKD